MDAKAIVNTFLKLALISLAVGLFLSFFEINPLNLLDNFGETVKQVFSLIYNSVEWAGKYIALGAMIVIPIWAVLKILDVISSKKKS